MAKFLFKANNAVVSHCICEGHPAMSSGQLDCPWCGCGFLITCSNCAKGFTFAEVRYTDLSMEEIYRREVRRRGLNEASEVDFNEWLGAMNKSLSEFALGDVVVYLDGSYFRSEATDIEFDGYFASHSLAQLPHVQALADPIILVRVLADKRYWLDRELPN